MKNIIKFIKLKFKKNTKTDKSDIYKASTADSPSPGPSNLKTQETSRLDNPTASPDTGAIPKKRDKKIKHIDTKKNKNRYRLKSNSKFSTDESLGISNQNLDATFDETGLDDLNLFTKKSHSENTGQIYEFDQESPSQKKYSIASKEYPKLKPVDPISKDYKKLFILGDRGYIKQIHIKKDKILTKEEKKKLEEDMFRDFPDKYDEAKKETIELIRELINKGEAREQKEQNKDLKSSSSKINSNIFFNLHKSS